MQKACRRRYPRVRIMGNQSQGMADLNLEVRKLLVGNVERNDM